MDELIIERKIQEICINFSKLLTVELTVVNENYVRIAGSGIFESKIGTNIDKDSLFAKVIDKGHSYIMSKTSEVLPISSCENVTTGVCQKCHQKNYCQDMLDLCRPIVVHGQVRGVLGMIAVDEKQKSSVIEQIELYDKMLAYISVVIEQLYQNDKAIFSDEEDKIMTFDALEKQEIIKAIHIYGDSTEGMQQIANALDIGIATLYRKIKKYKIQIN